MNTVECLNCGNKFSFTNVYEDDKGRYTVCPECKGSFDTNEEIELSEKHIERIDEIHNAIYEMCKVLTENEDLEWDMFYIGEIADFAANMLALMGNKIKWQDGGGGVDGRQE